MTTLKPTLIALACALLLVFTEQLTRTTIFENATYFETRLLRDMVPNTDIENLADGRWQAIQNGQSIASIREIVTNEGYNGRMTFLVAYDLQGAVLSIRVTDHRETPGLGDIIDHTVSDWLNIFTGRSTSNTNWALKPTGDIDGVSGATITARATTRAIALSLSENAVSAAP